MDRILGKILGKIFRWIFFLLNWAPGLQLLHPVEYPDVEEDEQREGDDDLHDEVHPEDVDPDVQRVGPHARWLWRGERVHMTYA